jgi:hypothetical protein
VVAKRTIRRCSGWAVIAHRSCVSGRQDSAEDGHVDLDRMVTGKHVNAVREDGGKILAQSRGRRRPELTGIVEVRRRQRRRGELSLVQPSGSRVQEREGKQRGSAGLHIGAARGRNGQGIYSN